MACSHFGDQKVNTAARAKQFKPHCVQASNTIIQQAHSSSSIKNRSRNKTFKRANVINSDKQSAEKVSRSNSKKCGCTFQFTIFYYEESSRWYLKKRRDMVEDNAYHFNHIFIDPIHLSASKHNIDKRVKQSLLNLVTSGSSIVSIQQCIRVQHKVNVSYQTIYNIRTNEINQVLKACSKHPYGSSVDKLISLFKGMDNVSYVYIMHNVESGFVTYRKNKKRMPSHGDGELGNNNRNVYRPSSVDNWRESLKLSGTNDVLVAFAWAHDNELKHTEMYPEFLSTDITFGVNKEHRELLLVVGIDGRNRTFTSFRCFIPSKQEHAYSWIVNEAFPHIMTTNVLKYNQCISCDEEHALKNSIEYAIVSQKDSMKNTKLRLDCFHFFTKIWNELTTYKSSTQSRMKLVMNVMKPWVLSWFKKLETQQELDISRRLFLTYLEKNNNVIPNYVSERISRLVQKIFTHQVKLLHCHFKDVSTFDFIGDSIVESANFPLKNGAISVSNKMDLSNSGFTQVKATHEKFTKESLSSALKINSSKTWSKSKTAEFLTDYAEGLACSNFDRRHQYTKKYIGNKTWLVCRSRLFHDKYETLMDNYDKKETRFLRVREVCIDDKNFMTCSCQYVQRWFMPCVHMCKVIQDMEHFTPELFHIRWWKHYHYFFKNNDNSNQNESTVKDMSSSLKNICDNHYDKFTGKYIGVPLNGSAFFKDRTSTYHTTVVTNDTQTDKMKTILSMQKNGIPLIMGSMEYMNYMDNETDITVAHDGKTDSQNVETMGAGSQTESKLSQFRSTYDSQYSSDNEFDVVNHDDDEVEVIDFSPYHSLQPLFDEIVKKVTTEAQLKQCQDIMEKLSFDLTSQQYSDTQISKTDTVFLGQENGSRRPEKRHRYFYEGR